MIFRYGEPCLLSGALHLELNKHGLDTYNVIIGDATFQAKLLVQNFLGIKSREKCKDDSVVTLNMNPPVIDFPGSRLVTKWLSIWQKVMDIHISGGATICWEEQQVMIRYWY